MGALASSLVSRKSGPQDVVITQPDPDGAGPLFPSSTYFVYDLAGNLTAAFDGYRAPWQNFFPFDVNNDGHVDNGML